MRGTRPERELRAGVVVVGAGAAGLSVALGLPPGAALVLTKAPLGQGGATRWAQGGVAAAVGEGDTPRLHAEDTVAAGAGLVRREVAEILAREGPARVAALSRIGARFDRRGGRLALGREAAHSRPRILHADGDATGAEILRALVAEARRRGVRVAPGVRAVRLLLEAGRVVGLLGRGPEGETVRVLAGAVVLASGGSGQLYRYTTNPPEATADGLALAARAGARLADLEFVQFHPTALRVDADPVPLITEALRGAGAVLVDDAGRRFMPDLHPDAELAPRDVVARAVWERMRGGGRVFLDARDAVGEAFPERFPTVFAAARAAGIDPRRAPLPVTPAAHYHMGGVAADARGRTSLPGLWACGEVACTGLHGANRLASNSLLEALVFGARVAADLAALAPAAPARAPAATLPAAAAEPRGARAALREIMWRDVGLVRTGTGLARAARAIARLEVAAPAGAEPLRGMLLVAGLVAAAARARTESRGGHHRADHPRADPAWRRRSFVSLASGRPRLTTGPVEREPEGRMRAG